MLDVGCWMLDVGCWMLDVGCWMSDVGCRMLDVGCWMSDVGCWMFFNGLVAVQSLRTARSAQGSWSQFVVERTTEECRALVSARETCRKTCRFSAAAQRLTRQKVTLRTRFRLSGSLTLLRSQFWFAQLSEWTKARKRCTQPFGVTMIRYAVLLRSAPRWNLGPQSAKEDRNQSMESGTDRIGKAPRHAVKDGTKTRNESTSETSRGIVPSRQTATPFAVGDCAGSRYSLGSRNLAADQRRQRGGRRVAHSERRGRGYVQLRDC